jgi:hypothetical protein
LYYTLQREGRSLSIRDEEPDEPSIEQLESMDRPPPDYIQEMSDYYYHHFVGKVNPL